MAARLTARQRLDRQVGENELMENFMNAARLMGWRVMHISDSRRMVNRGGTLMLVGDPECKGWPDLFLAHEKTGRLMAVEVKVEDPNRGKVSPEQAEWLRVLRLCGVETLILRPSTYNTAIARLRHRRSVAA